MLGENWPGIQLYYPPVKYSPALGIYEDVAQAAARMRKHAHNTNAHTLIFDLEDGCRQKEMSRDLLRQELPELRKVNKDVTIAIRSNSFRTDEYELDMQLVSDMSDCIDVVMLAKAGEAYGAAEVRDLSSFLIDINPNITIQPIIEHPKSLKIAPELMQYSTVKHVVFGIHDFSKAMAIHITPEHWIEELQFYMNQLMFEARIAGKGVIGGVETLIGANIMPEKFVEPHDVRRWLDLHGDNESRIVYKHACQEAAMGLTGKQVIHPGHIHLCKTAYTPSPTDVNQKVRILKAAIEADALHGGAIKFEGEMLDPPMFGKALQTLLRAHALRAITPDDKDFALHVLELLPAQVIRQNWPYGAIL
ncbi:MAG: aldolase/citrate lyase family protein [Methylotenera sp.]|uniref:HpcH/HpaI aldolase/citrate lyase family protein n=1 Tax=Methylotenera sp. TaxID=2051956 RepID=UPI0027177727|nr:aldolase/citrate lyase family protein [Methylotenera sp.]MDO9393533.1 aldolase/citrate lyase family protein [Methylotenera sp.]